MIHPEIEPTKLSISSSETDLLIDLKSKSGLLDRWLYKDTAQSLAKILRAMNCYYSNQIEGHSTRLVDIERALKNDFLDDEKGAVMQRAALSHISVQEEIDKLHATGNLSNVVSPQFIQSIHEYFYQNVDKSDLRISSENCVVTMTPGAFRVKGQEVMVGRHLAPKGESVISLMDYFHNSFSHVKGQSNELLAVPIAHHRFAYIHPFLDGNGRVGRLMSHAMMLESGVGANGLWSISRGLSRGLESKDEYKSKMALADNPRLGDLDGRGALSEKRLREFTHWFLKVSIDQIDFMTRLFNPAEIQKRLSSYVDINELPSESMYLLEAALYHGEIQRGEAPRLLDMKERSARKVLSQLTTDGILGSNTPKGAVSLRFDSASARIIFPRIYADFSYE